MIRRIRLAIVMVRPAVLALLATFTALGLARAGHAEDPVALLRAGVVVAGFLMFAAAVNDLADVEIDRVNLAGDRRRPLVTGAAGRLEFVVTAALSAALALGVAATINLAALAVTAAGLLLGAGYSLRPVRLAQRGAVASLVLPACYVAVPYLLGILVVRDSVRSGDLLLLAGLYVGFVGRILLKDFRDVRGDALFGKRTFLVRHGRRATCRFSAVGWVAGTAAIVAAAAPSIALVATDAVLLAVALVLLRALSVDAGPHRDEALVAALAIIARGIVVTLLAHLATTGWSPVASAAVTAALGVLTLGQARVMARFGPPARRLSPADERQMSGWPVGSMRGAAAAAPDRP